MLLTISTTHHPATDLGYLLHKHPERVQSFDLNFGQAHVFYPEVSEERATAALLLDINPIDLVRGRGDFALAQYVNDRPYAASSFLSVAIVQVFRTALSGICKTHPELVQSAIPLTATISALPARGGEGLLEKLFAPLGYELEIERHLLDPKFPQWGESHYYRVSLSQAVRLADLLSHLYVLIPVLDSEKHYYVGDEEVEKLLRHGEGWLAKHPEKELITARYLKYRRSLQRIALARLVEDTPEEEDSPDETEEIAEEKISLHQERLQTVVSVLKEKGVTSVVDLGCGEGKLLRYLLKERQFQRILGMDVSIRSLEIAHERLKLERLPEKQIQRIQLIHGSLMYRDARLAGYEAATVVEVIEHLDTARLAAFERVLFEFAKPEIVLITTPNREYNVMWESLPAGKFRHPDHRFEWTRAEFQTWAETIAKRFGYTVTFMPLGTEVENIGAPSQMGIFEKVTNDE